MFDMVPFERDNFLSPGDMFRDFADPFFNNDFFTPAVSNFGRGFKVDLKENDDSYVIKADLPGVKKDAIDLSFDNNYLTISAKREENKEDKDQNYVRRERNCGELIRSFYIDNVNDKDIKASFENGVLEIILPKIEKGQKKTGKIEIQ
ncbi:MAG TPA: heat-shock protein [Clostridium sp.]|jgi:HSP20 family protein|uniref:heat shock protein Hsp18 n=1 Tax=uncultured Clostridium sp. TaxID=59620 RepID=UPI000E819E43|nr:heat shock protein Hsp18 [uncultured Clostridium sp.]NLU07627.1 Hsp20/alpha crystallin family protein [Clostridiales bacterium]HBC95246.1 heat-shock protein [Clostridium sp.]